MDLDKRIGLTPRLADYVAAQAEPPSPAQRRLVEATAALGGVAEMQVPHEQSVLLTLLARSINATTVVEIGTFTGYSTLALARGLAPGGVVHTFDVSEEWSGIATRAWEDVGVRDRIRQHIGPAALTLPALAGDLVVDLAFVDADKTGYVGYWETLVPLVRPGGLILADNVLYAGEVVDDSPSPNGRAISEFNAHVRADDRVESVLLTIADGLTLARKKDLAG
jgi:caffeoyl-CoA O-methyltransferase